MSRRSGEGKGMALAKLIAASRVFADLLEENPDWRNKLLKNVQYVCKVSSWAVEARKQRQMEKKKQALAAAAAAAAAAAGAGAGAGAGEGVGEEEVGEKGSDGHVVGRGDHQKGERRVDLQAAGPGDVVVGEFRPPTAALSDTLSSASSTDGSATHCGSVSSDSTASDSGKGDPDPSVARLRSIAKVLSLARRIMIIGEALEDVRELLGILRSGNIRSLDFLLSSTSTATNLLDDVGTLSAIGIVPEEALPDSFDRVADTAWSISIVVSMFALVLKLRGLKRTEPAYTFKRFIAWISLVKYMCDMGQALPSALDVDTPYVFDSMCGLMSGLLSTYKIWYKETRSPE